MSWCGVYRALMAIADDRKTIDDADIRKVVVAVRRQPVSESPKRRAAHRSRSPRCMSPATATGRSDPVIRPGHVTVRLLRSTALTSIGTFSSTASALAHDADRGGAADRRILRSFAISCAAVGHRRAVEADDDVAGTQAAAIGAPSRGACAAPARLCVSAWRRARCAICGVSGAIST